MLGRNTEHTRTLRKTLVCTLLLSILLITLLNIKSVHAGPPPTPFISLNPNVGQVGSAIEMSGANFSPSDTSCSFVLIPPPVGVVNVKFNICVIDFNNGTIANLSGGFLVANVPPSVPPSTYTVTVTGYDMLGLPVDSASASFVVTVATCGPTPSPFPIPTPPPPSYPPPEAYQAANCGFVGVSPGRFDLPLGESFPTFYASNPFDSVKLSYPNSSILTNSVGDLLFAVRLTHRGIYQTVNIYIPPDFTGLSSTTQIWTSFTNNYNPSALACATDVKTSEIICHPTLRLNQAPPSDTVAPNWSLIQIQNLKVSCEPLNLTIASDGLPACGPAFVGVTDPTKGQFLEGTTEYVRLFAVTSPTIAGRYFFKVFLNSTSIGAYNFPTLVVKASKDPAYISGVLRYAENKDPSLIGKPIQLRPGEGAQVIATGYDYLGNPQSAQTFLNSTAEGNFTLFGVAPGTYNITAYAAGFVPAINAITVSVVAAQSLDQVNIYLFQSANITGTVYSEDENRQPTPWDVIYPNSTSINACAPALPIITSHINPVTGKPDRQVFECPRSIVIEALAVNENGTLVAQTPFPNKPSLFTDPTSSIFNFTISDTGWEGRIPQDAAYYDSGLGWGDYYLRAYVTQYVQFDDILVHVNNNTLDVESDIPLFRSGIFTVTAHFKDFNSTLIESPIPVPATLTATAYDLEGNLVAQNTTSIQAGSRRTNPPIELIGTSEVNFFGSRSALDYGIRPGTYHIVLTLTSSPVFTGYANVGVKDLYYQLTDLEGTIGLAPIDTQVSLSMYEAGALNLVMYSVDAERPNLPEPWSFPGQTISIQLISSIGVAYATNASQPAPNGNTVPAQFQPQFDYQIGPNNPENGTTTSLGFFYGGLLTDTYGVLVETVGYQRVFFHVHVTLGMNTDIRVNLLQMPIVNLTLAFRNEGLLTSIDSRLPFTQPLNQLNGTPIRMELFDSNGNLAGANISYIPDFTNVSIGRFPNGTAMYGFRPTNITDLEIDGFNQYYGDPKTVWAGFYDTTDAVLQPEGGLQPGTYSLLIWVDGYYQSTPLNFTLQLREDASLIGSVERASRISGIISGPDYYGQSRPLSWAIINLVPTGNESESRLPGWNNGMWLPGGFNYTTPSLDGFYQLWVPGDGPYSISVSLPGYIGYSGTIFVGLGSDTTLDYFLDALAPSYAYAQTQPLPIVHVGLNSNSTLPNPILTTDVLRWDESKTR